MFKLFLYRFQPEATECEVLAAFNADQCTEPAGFGAPMIGEELITKWALIYNGFLRAAQTTAYARAELAKNLPS